MPQPAQISYGQGMVDTEPTPEAIGLFAFTLFSKLEGAVTAGMVHLGDRLCLYRAMADAGDPVT